MYLSLFFEDTLAAATNNGQVAIWKQNSAIPSEDGWSHETTFNADGEISTIAVGQYYIIVIVIVHFVIHVHCTCTFL